MFRTFTATGLSGLAVGGLFGGMRFFSFVMAPWILRSLPSVNASVDDAAETVRAILKLMETDIVSDTSTEAGRLVEATYTSTWFGFIDDFVVRLQPGGNMTLVDVRSKSRVGKSDLGANARRVTTFFEKIDAAMA